MHVIETPAYRKGFNQYLRKGTPIEYSLKMMMQEYMHNKMLGNSTHYTWRTQDDAKVRPSHAANDDKIFAWDNPPVTGHPGEDFNCRCWAEPIGDNQYVRQLVITPINDSVSKWQWYDFVFHYYFGGGSPVTLSQVALFNGVANLAHTDGLHPHQVGEGVEKQILNSVKETSGDISIVDTFSNGYDFYDVAFVLRKSKVYGQFTLEVDRNGRHLVFRGIVEYNFEDYFQDPLDIMQGITMLPEDIIAFIQKIATAKGWDEETLAKIYKDMEKIAPQDIPRWIHAIAGFGGTPYSITGSWETKINGTTTHD